MDKELLKKSIEAVEESIKQAEENTKISNHHIEEGKIILEALNKQKPNA